MDKIEKLKANGVETLCIGKKDGHIDLNELMYELGKRDIDSILLEGGGTLNWSALDSGIVNKSIYIHSSKVIRWERSENSDRGAWNRLSAECGFA